MKHGHALHSKWVDRVRPRCQQKNILCVPNSARYLGYSDIERKELINNTTQKISTPGPQVMGETDIINR